MTHEIIKHGARRKNYSSKYVIDIQIKAIAVEHRFYGDTKIPVSFRLEVQYGNEIIAVVATLAGQGLFSSSRIVDMISSMSRGAFELSDGNIYNFLVDFNNKTYESIETIKTKLLNNPVMNVD